MLLTVDVTKRPLRDPLGAKKTTVNIYCNISSSFHQQLVQYIESINKLMLFLG